MADRHLNYYFHYKTPEGRLEFEGNMELVYPETGLNDSTPFVCGLTYYPHDPVSDPVKHQFFGLFFSDGSVEITSYTPPSKRRAINAQRVASDIIRHLLFNWDTITTAYAELGAAEQLLSKLELRMHSLRQEIDVLEIQTWGLRIGIEEKKRAFADFSD